MKIELEGTGGFTGPAGKQVIQVDTDKVGPAVSQRLHRDLEQIPADAWGKSFESAQPKPWDFLYNLSISQDGKQKSVRFHQNQGPPQLSRLVEQLTNLDTPNNANTPI